MNRLQQIRQLYANMGGRYLMELGKHQLAKKTGLLRYKFPSQPKEIVVPDLVEWQNSIEPFFFQSKSQIRVKKRPAASLQQKVNKIKSGQLKYFSNQWFDFQKENRWHENPTTFYSYDNNVHWSQIQDIDASTGDIKYVWEPSRFCFLYDLIRFDYHFDQDESPGVFEFILDWIDSNPINLGPNYICSQEISIRLLNWVFAIHYYRYSPHLTEVTWKKIILHIYWMTCHVYEHIGFSRKVVRNNHSLTECAALFTIGLCFPFLPNGNAWKSHGLQWFGEELSYQVYNDGTYIQHSNNYHRVVLQLLSWVVALCQKSKIEIPSIINEKAQKSLDYMNSQIHPENGHVPNLGMNDGSLFFPLSHSDYLDYRPQNNTLNYLLNSEVAFPQNELLEELEWFGVFPRLEKQRTEISQSVSEFSDGGIYMINHGDVKIQIKCARYSDRPHQADNLHIDLWVNQNNYLIDSGSYSYNTDQVLTDYFNGSKGHNTCTAGEFDQMLKGSRFIWYYWIKVAEANIVEQPDRFIFKGTCHVHQHVGKGIVHSRQVQKFKNDNRLVVIDELVSDHVLNQWWHVNPKFIDRIHFESKDHNGTAIKPEISQGWFSTYYGEKKPCVQIKFSTAQNQLSTSIEFS